MLYGRDQIALVSHRSGLRFGPESLHPRLNSRPTTSETHRAIGLGLPACHQGRRVRFYTAARLVNELILAACSLAVGCQLIKKINHGSRHRCYFFRHHVMSGIVNNDHLGLGDLFGQELTVF